MKNLLVIAVALISTMMLCCYQTCWQKQLKLSKNS